MTDTVDWKGKSGNLYRYWFLDSLQPDRIKAVAGNYAFVKLLPNGNFRPLYFGQTENLRDRLPYHEVWQLAVKRGATHVMTHTSPGGEATRLAEEQDLIAFWNPELNTQHRTAS